MTFDEWVATERVGTGECDLAYAGSCFGYMPEGIVAAHIYATGVIAMLENGKFFTHIGRSEHTGTLQEVREILWRDHASIEVK